MRDCGVKRRAAGNLTIQRSSGEHLFPHRERNPTLQIHFMPRGAGLLDGEAFDYNALFRPLVTPLPPRCLHRYLLRALALLTATVLFLEGETVFMGSAHAEEPAPRPAAELYKEGFAAFAVGDWRRAADSLQGVLNAAAAAGADANFKPDSPEAAAIESATYTLGAALFNLGDHAKAIAALNNFLKKFPRSPRAVDATFALA